MEDHQAGQMAIHLSCVGNPVGDAYARRAIGLAERMSARAGVALPLGLRTRALARGSPAP